MGAAINFVIFMIFLGLKLALDHVDFMRPTTLRERVSISYNMCGKCSADHKALVSLACKSDNRVKSRCQEVKQKSCQTFLCFNTGLAQGCGISSAFATGIHILGHIIYDLLNFAKSRLCIFADYS